MRCRWLLAVTIVIRTLGFADDDKAIHDLLQKMEDAEPKVMHKLESFGYRETETEDSSGKIKRKTFEVTYLKDRRIRRLIETDGKPLTGSALEHENKRVEKLVTQLEKGTAPPLDRRRIRVAELHQMCVFSNLQRVKLAGRDVVQCEFHPRLGFKPTNMQQRFVHNIDGKLWLDEQLLQIARAEFTLRDSFKIAGGVFFNMKPGSRFVDEETLYGGEVWLPKLREFRMSGKALMGVTVKVHNTITFSEYHRFDVSAHDNVVAK